MVCKWTLTLLHSLLDAVRNVASAGVGVAQVCQDRFSEHGVNVFQIVETVSIRVKDDKWARKPSENQILERSALESKSLEVGIALIQGEFVSW